MTAKTSFSPSLSFLFPSPPLLPTPHLLQAVDVVAHQAVGGMHWVGGRGNSSLLRELNGVERPGERGRGEAEGEMSEDERHR